MINCAKDPRCGLQITRFHTWPTVRRQSNGEHSAQVARILLMIWPTCPRKMLVHAIAHDTGEAAGDIEQSFKVRFPELKRIADQVEKSVRAEQRDIFGGPEDVVLSDWEKSVFRIVDRLECWEFALQEINLGNQYARIMAQRSLLAASDAMESLGDPPPGAPDVRPAIKRYVDVRLKWETQDDGQP